MKHIKFVALASLLAGNVALAAPALPPTTTVGAVTYVSGGVGSDESAAFKEAAPGFPLELQFVLKAKPRDEYAADVSVNIADAQGKTVLDTTSTGPFMLIKLPNGRYKVQATKNGQTQSRTVDVSDHHQRVVFAWTP